MFLKVYQIYYSENQKELLEPAFISYFNETCTHYFENEVIKTLLPEIKDCEYFGVVSYSLEEKIRSVMKDRWKALPNITNHSDKKFSIQLFENDLREHLPDVMSFQRHIGHDPISYANNFHPNFSNYFGQIMSKIGFDWKPVHIKDIFYCNYFVAKQKVYKEYVNSMLIPAMEVMNEMPELWGNSNYPKPLPENLQTSLGIKHYPYHTFLCERMFSWYAHINNLNCRHF